MSSEDRGLEEAEQELLQTTAATVIQRAWRRHVCTEVFKYLKELIGHCNQQDPQSILKAVNPREAELLDAASGLFIRFRLGGNTFPPNIYYKIFTHRPITDMCASSPRDYTQSGLKRPGPRQINNGLPLMLKDRLGWYQRMENNSWRIFCKKVVPFAEPIDIGANKKMDFHYSRLRRQQEVDRWKKRRKIKWLRQMYNWGRLQTHPSYQHTTTVVANSAQKAMDAIEEKGEDEVEDWEVDELLAWTNTLSFEEYIQEWKHLACSHTSEQSKDFHSDPPCSEPQESAGET